MIQYSKLHHGGSTMSIYKKISFIILVFFLSLSLHADSPVWKISNEKSSIYLGGTIHVLKPTDFPLDKAFHKAYNDSDKIYFEVDIDKVNSREFQEKATQKLIYTDGQTLKDNISDKTYKLLEEFFINKGMHISMMQDFKPSMLVLIMTVMELESLGFHSAGVDDFFYKLAKKDNKKIGALESIDDQLRFLVNMGKGQEDQLLRYTIKDLENTSEMMEKIKDMWSNAKLQEMNQYLVKPMYKEFPTLYKEILVDRNNNWMPIIKDMFNTEEKELVLVGFLHLVGEDGLLHQLKKDGYKIEMID
jgi:uncharacterized protein